MVRIKPQRLQPLFHKINHHFIQAWKKASEALKIRWVQAWVAFFVLVIIFNKDIAVSLRLQSPKQNIASEQVVPAIVKDENVSTFSAESLFDEIPTHLMRHLPSAKDTNLANTFSNLGFLLNPGLAKRLKVGAAVVAIKQKKCDDYIKTYAPAAVKEMELYGIPASITLAQGLLESNVGDSKLAKRNNNHFGIKCFSKTCTHGHCTNYSDDSHKDFFRKYGSVWESYREHSQFLQRSRYEHLKDYGTKDYKNWAHGLRKAGYATDPKYAYKLIQIIERLELHRFDQ